ncbi:twin-arginine translocation pathway signal protein [Sabulilitoribacter arenilitoris]|uniref:Twin-arginine translocation pathway signal protein n=1 Tax=Wocania arenilitoris TaxID=2044858 RepID=A0AAE3ENC4_9FLAO|nr:twin-arginine translocation pathway signal protein [Wocania arenilitoris]MCF7567632.1 twin-arginine translocation pathway signal protein [Wocania arenilitoris]
MNRRNYIKTVLLGSVIPVASGYGIKNISAMGFTNQKPLAFKSKWHLWQNMKWIGPQYWGNRLQDWELKNGQAICVVKGKNRNLHLLTVQNPKGSAEFETKVTINILDDDIKNSENSFYGIRLGVKGRFDDYRSSAVFGKGLDIGLNLKGNLVFGNKIHKTNLNKIPKNYTLHVTVKNADTNKQLLSISIIDTLNSVIFNLNDIEVSNKTLKGGFALISNIDTKRNNNYKPLVGFENWNINSKSLYSNEENIYGPICFSQYTLNRKKLKITTQLSPIEDIKGHKVLLQFKKDNNWKTQEEQVITHAGRAINFSVDNWNAITNTPYRIRLQIPLVNELHQYDYNGTILAEPKTKDTLKAAVFSCNFDYGFPDSDVNENVSKLNPDICLFLGDQFYEATGGYGVQFSGDFDKMCLDYLRKWMMFGWSYRELFRHRPCAIIPDDHDVYHGNIWGEEGKLADNSDGYGASSQDSGGYKMTPEWVNMVQFTQTSHLPDPYDTTSVKNNIGVYYTHWNYAGISFAILEDRKFKSAPSHVLPKQAKVYNGWIMADNFDIKKYRDLDAELLGSRQEDFLKYWVQDWSYGAQMKAVLSQTNFATVATLPEEEKTGAVVPKLYVPEIGEYIQGDKPTVDMDSNGWPAKKRDKAVEIIRKGFAFHIAGDQHLGSFIQYGLDEFEDSGFAFAGPALNNIWPRRFWPPVDSSNHSYDNPAYTGNHIDGFGNKMTVKAVANPHNMHKEPKVLHNRAVGYGIVTFNKKDRTIKTECFKRFIDPEEKDAQYPGWPQTITQEDNYGRKAVAYLPQIKIKGLKKPVIEIINESTKKVEYTLRINSKVYKPKIFEKLNYYTIRVGDPDKNIWKEKKGVSIKSKKITFKFY